MNETHTTRQGKAKCLNYRNGKRCGRVAKALVTWYDARTGWHKVPTCQECAQAHLADPDHRATVEDAPGGLCVRTGLFTGTREYRALER